MSFLCTLHYVGKFVHELSCTVQCHIDIDECADPLFSSKCPENAHCMNTPGNYSCVCNEGYESGGDSNICQGKLCIVSVHITLEIILQMLMNVLLDDITVVSMLTV